MRSKNYRITKNLLLWRKTNLEEKRRCEVENLAKGAELLRDVEKRKENEHRNNKNMNITCVIHTVSNTPKKQPTGSCKTTQIQCVQKGAKRRGERKGHVNWLRMRSRQNSSKIDVGGMRSDGNGFPPESKMCIINGLKLCK